MAAALYNAAMDIMLAGFAKGWTLNMGLIIAIGAQNAFVLAQGIGRRFVFVTALTCSLCDALLIAVGVAFATAATGHWATRIMALAGGVFLLWCSYGAMRAMRRGGALFASSLAPRTGGGAVAASLALSLLNPHAFLEWR